MNVVGLDHVQVAAPRGCEAEARWFYGTPLGLVEMEKPESLRGRGGVWFRCGEQQLHTGMWGTRIELLSACCERSGSAVADRRLLFFGDSLVAGVGDPTGAGCSSSALATILEEAASIGLPTPVVGPAPVDDPEQNRRIRSLSVSFAEVCARRGMPFVSAIEGLLASPVWMEQIAVGDGAHPGDEGYDALARLVLAGGWLDWLRSNAR